MVMIQFVMGAYSNSLADRTLVVENQRHELADRYISLLARRATLTTPENIQAMAGKALSLHLPERGQVSRFNKRKGRFERL